MERGAVGGRGRGRIERVGEDGQCVKAAVPVTGNGVEIAGVDP